MILPLTAAALLLSQPALDTVSLVIRAELQGSLDATLRAHAPEHGSALAAQVARLLRWRGDVVKDLHPGDRVRLVYTIDAEGPELWALDYAGTSRRLAAYRYELGGVPRFFDAAGALVEPALTNSPVACYVQITETVQHGRGKRRHQGLDLKAPVGTPVRLPFDGVVSRVNWSRRGNGNCVEVALRRGGVARFLHLASVDPGMQPSAAVLAGSLVGTVGSTGHSTAPHLHYELRAPDGGVLDPLREHGTTQAILSDPERANFLARKRDLDALMTSDVALRL